MSEVRAVPWRLPMTGRDRSQPHRAATPLELLFDLCFVVAVASAAASLHHALAEGHLLDGVVSYLMVFFAVWWAWMNFTWFASAYDTDDVLHRLLTMVQMGGALVLAAGVPTAFEEKQYTVMVIGYVIMRVPMVVNWLRAAHDHEASRSVARAYAIGIAVVQVLWLVRLALPASTGVASFVVLALAELAVPYVAEQRGPMTPWHADHIIERYGLFTILVLGEVILASTTSIRQAVTAEGLSFQLLGIAVGGLVVLFGMWWLYFKRAGDGPTLEAHMFLWGYGHIFVFSSVAAVGAGIAALADVEQHHAHITARQAGLALAVALTVYLVVLSALHISQHGSPLPLVRSATASVVLLLVGGSGLPPGLTVLLMGATVAALVATHLVQDSPVGTLPVAGRDR